MVVEDEDVDFFLVEKIDGFHGGRAAIDREHDIDIELIEAFLQRNRAEPIAIVKSAGKIRLRVPAESGQHLHQQCGGADAVHVVVAINQQPLVVTACLPKPLDGGFHVWNKKRVGQQLEPGVQELADFRLVGNTPVDETLRQ